MRKTLTALMTAAALVGFAGAAWAAGGCSGMQSVQKSTPIETAQADESTLPQTPKPAETN